MKKSNWVSKSILGLILLSISLITVAMLGNRDENIRDMDGSLTDSFDGSQIFQTCTLTNGTVGARCNVTSSTLTTSSGAVNSFDQFFLQTIANTTTV